MIHFRSIVLIGLLTVLSTSAAPFNSATYDGGPKTAENHLIKLRYAMDKASSIKQQKALLDEVGANGTFQAMMYSAHFLDIPRLEKAASKAFVRIALEHPEYNGAQVRSLLRHAYMHVGSRTRSRILQYLNNVPVDEVGFQSLFNGVDLTGWKGLVANPIKRAAMKPEILREEQRKADDRMRDNWKVDHGCLVYVGKGYDNLCTISDYTNFEMYVDWMLDPSGKEPDAGIYLRGTPQVQIWDTARVNVGAQVGSGGLYNNKKYESKPSVVADNMTGIWNSFYIRMVDNRVTVFLNGIKVVDNVIMENYWDRSQPIFPKGQIELQAHGSKVYFRDLYVRRLK